jgi:hypothetical protein
LLPDVVRLHARGEVRKLVAINQAYLVVAGSAVNLGAIVSYPLIPYLYAEWTAHAVALDRPLLCLLLGSVVVNNSGALMALHLNGINSLRIVLGASMARAALCLGCGLLGFARLGLASFGVGALLGEIVATAITARHFVLHEVHRKGFRIPVSDFAPVSVSTVSVLVFLVGAGFGWWGVGWAWLLVLLVTVAASIWGWKELDTELRDRLRNIPTRLLGFGEST